MSSGLANVAVITVVSVLTWWLLVDPSWSASGLYPQPFTALLFWSVLMVVWLGFNLEFHGFDQFRQPLRGVLLTALVFVLAGLITTVIARGWGAVDQTFAADRDGGAGYLAGALWVLFGFFFYVTSVINWGHWPWAKSGLTQPWLGIGQISLLVIPTTICFLVLALPGLASWADPLEALLDTSTLIGWFYSVIVSVMITGLLLENWPWRLAAAPGRVAAFSVVGNIGIGTGIYLAFRPLTEAFLGADNTAALGPGITVFPAELGVCWVLWMVLWSNCFGNKPTDFSAPINYLLRMIITFVLGVVTFFLYYFVVAGTVLHEPAITSSLNGDALGWIDWVILWTLLYVLCFQSWGIPSPSTEVEPTATEPVGAGSAEGEQARSRT